MMKLKMNKLVVVSLVLASFLSSSISTAAPACRSFLDRVRAEGPTVSAEIEKDLEAIEVLASVSLSTVLATGKYKTVPRIKPKDRGSYKIEKFLFDKISEEDRAAILKDLTPKMLEMIKVSPLFSKTFLGRFSLKGLSRRWAQSPLRLDFDDRYVLDSMEARIERNEDYLQNFLDRSLDTIIFNAANAPGKTIPGNFVLFLKRSIKYVVGGVLVGAGAELVDPNIFFKEMPLEDVQNMFQYAVNELSFWEKSAVNGVALAAPARVISVPANLLKRLFYRGWRNVDVGNFDMVDYDLTLGQETRKNFSDLIPTLKVEEDQN